MRMNHQKNHYLKPLEDQEIELDDLGLGDEADDIKGGPDLPGADDGGGGRGGGDWIINHNETIASDTEVEANLTDLGLIDEADDIKGGPGRPGSEDDGGGGIGGDWLINHNETIASDAEIEANLTDLGLLDDEVDEIKGGPGTPGSEDGGGGGMGGDWVINHNETVLADRLS